MNASAGTVSPGDMGEAIRAWGWDWMVVPKWRSLFKIEPALSWLTLSESTDAQLLKESDLRSVWRVRVGEQTVVAKVYQPLRGWNWLKALVLGHPAKREYRAALYGRRNNLSVVRPIACGKPSGGSLFGPYVLLTEEIHPAQPLSPYWLSQIGEAAQRSRAVENSILCELARFLAILHDGSFLPSDLHPDNIMIRTDHDPPRPVLVDLYKSRFARKIPLLARIGNLADLNQWFQRHASRTNRLRFLLAYLSHSFDEPSNKLVRRYVGEVNEVTGWKAEKLEKKRDKRIWGDNKYYGRIPLPNSWTAYVFLQAKRPLQGSRCSQRRFEKSDWMDTLASLVSSDHSSQPTCIQVGSYDIPIALESSADQSSRLNERWTRDNRKVNRHQSVALPLALLEQSTPGKGINSILIVERSEDGSE